MDQDSPHHDEREGGTPRVAVWLAERLRRVRVPSRELAGAQSRVEQRVLGAIPHDTPRRRTKRGGVGVAVALSLLAAAVLISALASSALPTSPLYAVKRSEEWIAYQTAWSDARRGEVLFQTANHRLQEARTLGTGEEQQAVSLALELRGNLTELVQIYQTMRLKRFAAEDTRPIVSALRQMVTDQMAAGDSAELGGRHSLAATLRENARLVSTSLAT